MEQRAGQARPAAVGGEPHGPAERGGGQVRRDVSEGPGGSGDGRRPRILEPLRHGHRQQPGRQEQRDLGDPEQRHLSAAPSDCGHEQNERRGRSNDRSHQDGPGPGEQSAFFYARRRQQRDRNQLRR